MKKEKTNYWKVFGIVVIIIIVIISFGLVFYYFNKSSSSKIREPEKDNELVKQEALTSSLKVKEELRNKLEKRVKTSFVVAKLFVALFYIGLNFGIYMNINVADFNTRISIILNYNQVALIIITFVLLVVYSKPTDVSKLFTGFHLYIRKKTYEQYEGLHEEIKALESEILSNNIRLYQNNQ